MPRTGPWGSPMQRVKRGRPASESALGRPASESAARGLLLLRDLERHQVPHQVHQPRRALGHDLQPRRGCCMRKQGEPEAYQLQAHMWMRTSTGDSAKFRKESRGVILGDLRSCPPRHVSKGSAWVLLLPPPRATASHNPNWHTRGRAHSSVPRRA